MQGDLVIAEETPDQADIRALLIAHRQSMDDQAPGVPATSQHALDLGGLMVPEITFLAGRVAGKLAVIGALKALNADEGELKSMHVAKPYRGHGLGRVMLEHLLGHARRKGMARVSLETGAQPGFAPSRRLYESAGFQPCAPFADYAPDPNSAFMTRDL